MKAKRLDRKHYRSLESPQLSAKNPKEHSPGNGNQEVDRDEGVRISEVRYIVQLSLCNQISYKWLFNLEINPPFEHASLPFSKPIPQDVNS